MNGGGYKAIKEKIMKPIDIILIIGAVLIIGGIIAYLIISKRKGKNVGCGCGCSGCPNASACGGGKAEKESAPETEETSCPHCHGGDKA